jgi:hypothetical protein
MARCASTARPIAVYLPVSEDVNAAWPFGIAETNGLHLVLVLQPRMKPYCSGGPSGARVQLGQEPGDVV